MQVVSNAPEEDEIMFSTAAEVTAFIFDSLAE
jgi:hypothetical protein